MPTYAYRCTACDHSFEAQQSFTDDALTVCPACEGRLRKVFSSVGVVFKGSGFYRNDARSGSASRSGSTASSTSSPNSSSSPSSTTAGASSASGTSSGTSSAGTSSSTTSSTSTSSSSTPAAASA